MPFSRLRNTFSITTMASSTTKPTETASAISEMLSIEKPAAHIAAQVPASASGTVTPAAKRRRGAAQEQEHHQHDQNDGGQQRELHVVDAGADGLGAVGQHGNLDVGGDPALEVGQHLVDAVDGVDDIGVGLLGDDQQHRWLGVEPSRRAAVADAELDIGDGSELHQHAVRRLDHQILVIGHRAELIVGADGVRQIAAVEGAERGRRVGVGDRGADILHGDAHGGDRHRVDADPHRRLLGAVDGDLGDAVDLGHALGDHAVGHVVHVGRRHGLRGQRQDQDRRRRRIDLAHCGQASADRRAGRSARR